MPRSATANEQIRAQRREDILHAATPVFARKGFAGTRIADLAEASGMSQGLLYRYFASKDEVFAAIVAETVRFSVALAQQAYERPGTPWGRLYWFVAAFLPPQYECPEYALVISHALTSEAVPQGVREQALQQLSAFSELIRDLIIAGQAEGEIVLRDPEQLTLHLLATLHGLAATAAFLREQAPRLPDPEVVLLALRPASEGLPLAAEA